MKKTLKAILSAILFLAAVVPLLILDWILFVLAYAFSNSWHMYPLIILFVLVLYIIYGLGRVLLKDWL